MNGGCDWWHVDLKSPYKVAVKNIDHCEHTCFNIHEDLKKIFDSNQVDSRNVKTAVKYQLYNRRCNGTCSTPTEWKPDKNGIECQRRDVPNNMGITYGHSEC